MELAQTEEPIFLDYSLDELLLDLTGINGEIKQASAAEKKLKAKKRFIEEQIRYAMRQQGISKAGNDSCTVNVKTETHYRPDPESWEEFLAWIYENEYLHLLKRDFNSSAVKELVGHLSEQPGGETVPFVIASDVEKLNYRSS